MDVLTCAVYANIRTSWVPRFLEVMHAEALARPNDPSLADGLLSAYVAPILNGRVPSS